MHLAFSITVAVCGKLTGLLTALAAVEAKTIAAATTKPAVMWNFIDDSRIVHAPLARGQYGASRGVAQTGLSLGNRLAASRHLPVAQRMPAQFY
jgi:hypothetical protein